MDKVQKNHFTYYNAPSSETFKLKRVFSSRPTLLRQLDTLLEVFRKVFI
jgi:hypothetical protein